MTEPNSGIIWDKEKRRIWILGKITLSSAKKFSKFLNILGRSPDPLEIIISSRGGSFFPCLTIYQEIKDLCCPTKTIGFGQVYSAAFFIFQAGDERISSKGTSFKFHQMIDEIRPKKGEELNSDYYFEKAKTLNRADAIQCMIFTLRGRPVSKIFTLLQFNVGFTAQSAKKMKLVDKIISPQKVPKPPKTKGQK